ncbi:MAG TPA: alpha-galactosidase [Armatimonadota bacterium]|jgi:alpha-galactosidase
MKRTDQTPMVRPEDMALCRRWTGAYFDDPSRLPFSFRLGQETIHGIPDSWHPKVTSRLVDASFAETTVRGIDDRTGLAVQVEARVYRDFPVVEWVVLFSNTHDSPTPILSDLQALDAAFAGREPVLYHCNGDFYNEEGYTPTETPLPKGKSLTFAPNGGRPCDGAFPYYRVRFEGCGLTLAVGWPGQWSANFAGTEDGVSVRAGQEQTHLRLLPGESVRTPRMTLMAWTGDTERAVNLWRRWYRAHVLPRSEGRPMPPMLASAGTDTGEEFTAATEENQLRYQEEFTRRGVDFDVWWIDAGWYPCKDAEGHRHWPRTGTWVPDPERFPRGLKPVSEGAAKTGARLLIWFEPERVTKESALFKEHPDWLLRTTEEDNNALLNLGLPACREWLTDHVCGLIRESGIGIYRQDFNFPPLAYWRTHEAEDRRGMNENLYVQGYLRYWDDLRARNPGLWIDSCASGGRRNDLETMRRSVPLHYTDFGYGNHPVKLAFHHTLFEWIPYFKECTLSWDVSGPDDDTRFDKAVDSFAFHCAMAAMLFPSFDIRRDDYDTAVVRQMVGLWRQAAPILLDGDYYPLTPFSRDPFRWVAWQFDRPERGDGMLQGIRLAACQEQTLTVTLRGLEPGAEYLFENPETGEQRHLSEADLSRDGFTLSLPPRSGAIWLYRRVVKPSEPPVSERTDPQEHR